jgi:hypothetical protein
MRILDRTTNNTNPKIIVGIVLMHVIRKGQWAGP